MYQIVIAALALAGSIVEHVKNENDKKESNTKR